LSKEGGDAEGIDVRGAKGAVTVDWLLLTRWRSVVRHVTMRARATRRVVS